MSTAVVVSAALVGLSLQIRAQARRVLAEQLDATQRVLLEVQRGLLGEVLATSFVIGESPTLRAAIETYRLESAAGGGPRGELLRTVQRELDGIAADLGAELLAVTDERGAVLAASARSAPAPAPGTDLSMLPALRRALEGAAPAGDSSFAVAGFGGRHFYLGCVPVVLRGFPIGAMLLGASLDAAFAARLTAGGSDVVVRTDGEVLLSSLTGRAGQDVHSGPPEALARAAGRAGGARLGGEQFVVAAMPLALDASGGRVTLYLLRSVTRTAHALQEVLLRNFAFYGALAAVLAALAAAAASRSVLASFHRFAQYVGSVVQTRDYARPFDVSEATAELRTIAGPYGQLIASLAQSHAQLAETNRELQQQVAERERAEEALREREEQLRQSQKLEAVGTLAGGIAHDFNNILTVINSYSELLMADLDPKNPMRADLEQIRNAASRGARLTSQLLAFSRKQVLQPKVIDLNAVVTGMEKMLQRVIGEDIEMRIVTQPRIARVRADRHQLEQVLVNLVVNARDAMPSGGRLSIETASVIIRTRDPARHGDTPPGRWVRLSVSDSGVGMDAAVMERIFEPFFTTKGVGKGTGLGLSMVYGIVKQSEGHICVFSRPEKGSTFHVYLPPDEAAAEAPGLQGAPSGGIGGSETILVVEDEDALRSLVQRTLRSQGYTVLAAGNGPQALEVAGRFEGTIHLMLTDVVMPHMGGPELARAFGPRRPETRVLYMSGYTDDALAHHNVLDAGVELLQKPFTPTELAAKVREVLDAPHASREARA